MGGRGATSGFEYNAKKTSDEVSALEHYVSGEGMWINQYLRNGSAAFGELSPQEMDYLKDLQSATQKDTIKTDVLYRSVDASAVFGNISDLQFENLQSKVVYGADNKFANEALKIANSSIGKTITEKGFMSTTTDKQLAFDWQGFSGSSHPVVLKIKTPGKVKGADMRQHSMAQNEVLLGRNHKYTIESIGAQHGQIYVTVKLH